MALGKIAIPVVSIVLVVGVVIGVVVVVKNKDAAHDVPTGSTPSMKAVTSICEYTTYKESCAASLETAAKNASATPKDFILAAVEAASRELNKSREATGKVVVDKEKDEYNHMAVEDCKELLEYAADTLQASISMVGDSDLHTLEDRAHELLSWVTSVYAFQTDCTDFVDKPEYKSAIENGMVNATQLTHNAVNIVAEMSQILKMFNVQTQLSSAQRKLMSAEDGFPSWFSGADRRLLAAGGGAAAPNAVVAKDGSGKFKTINDALASYPAKHEGRFVIYVKAGVYEEKVIVDKKKPNVYIYGDGIGKTIVTGKLNFGIMKIGTMNTATFANEAENFVARAITFRNDAGPEGHQAVAFRSIGDKAALFDCSFEASQDTLYYQNQRQFYRNCRIYGTIDFIFGKGTCLIQDSEIIARKPLDNQFNTVTADGKEIKSGTNGLVLQNCRIVPDNFLSSVRFEIPTFLGRPWKKFALTVTMQSELADFIRPEGYKLWDGEPNHKTCFMYEYANRGPGANIDHRSKDFVNFRVISQAEAARFAAGPLLAGAQWLPQTGVPFRLGL